MYRCPVQSLVSFDAVNAKLNLLSLTHKWLLKTSYQKLSIPIIQIQRKFCLSTWCVMLMWVVWGCTAIWPKTLTVFQICRNLEEIDWMTCHLKVCVCVCAHTCDISTALYAVGIRTAYVCTYVFLSPLFGQSITEPLYSTTHELSHSCQCIQTSSLDNPHFHSNVCLNRK